MRSRATARAVEPAPAVPATDPAGLDSDLESALLAGLSEGGEELPEETGAPAPEAAPEAPPARVVAAEPAGAPPFERLPAPGGPAEAGARVAVLASPNGPEPGPSEDGSQGGLDLDSELDFGTDPEPSPEPPGTGIDDLLARLADDDENASGMGVDLGLDEAPGEERPRLDPAPDPDVSGADSSPEVSGLPAAARDRPPAEDDPFPSFVVEDILTDAVEDGPGFGDVVEFGERPELGDDPAAVHDPVHEAGPGLEGPATLDHASPPGEEPAREDAALGGPFDDALGASAEAADKVEEPGADAAGGGLLASGTDADTEIGFPAAEPPPAAPGAPSPIAPAAEPEAPAPFAFATDPESESALRAGLSDHPLPQVWPGDLRTAVATLGAGHAPRLLFVDLDGTPYPAGAIHELASVCEVGTEVIAFGSNATARFSREILLAGVSDYLVKPLTAEAVREAGRSGAGVGATAADPGGWSVGFAGTGGTGSTTLAAATALLAAERGRYVSVLDLDRTFPALAFLLDVEPASGLVEVLSTAARASLHAEMVDGMRAKRSDRISVYGYPWNAVPAPPPPVWAVCELLQELQRRSHLVIVDGLDDPATRFALLAVTDGRVLVVEPTGTGAPAGARLLERLRPMAGSERVALVVQNHTRAGKAKAGAKVLREAGVEPAPEVLVPFEPTLPAVTDRGWPNDRLPKPLRKPLDTLVDRVLAGERTASGPDRAATGAETGADAARAFA